MKDQKVPVNGDVVSGRLVASTSSGALHSPQFTGSGLRSVETAHHDATPKVRRQQSTNTLMMNLTDCYCQNLRVPLYDGFRAYLLMPGAEVMPTV